MDSVAEAKLRANYLSSRELRQLGRLREWKLFHKHPHREESMQPSDYCLFSEDDYLRLVEDHVSKNGWNW